MPQNRKKIKSAPITLFSIKDASNSLLRSLKHIKRKRKDL
jgi:hypothetical protein